MNNIKKYLAYYITIIITSFVLLFAQSTSVDAQCCKNMMHGKGNHDHGKVKEDVKSELVREGKIDLKAIDVNEDGKVFQDQMDWNVISDTKGSCPICNMELKEVSLAETKENLIKNGFEVK